MIQEYTRLARPYFVLLAIFTIGRWLMGTAFAVPYDKGTHALSIVTLTLFASIFSAAFVRGFLGYRLTQAAGLAMFMALVSQVVVLLSTVASYLLGIHSYFNEPIAIHNRLDPIALELAGSDDVVVVAGKGHERHQEVDGQKQPFSDVEHVLRAAGRS